ncbi:MAG: acylneuraminate cytidylyltransferase [Bacteroidetes bacterium]|nr:MAG: acylneuraminate cytidylyltransferase [Bacteroidota bacterium]PIE88381.1 MAG: acylneuraminate cytidylyltransferase [Bacteroidota bacterium]
MNIKLFITDIDGVWTDGGMYYSEKGDEQKRFNTSDSAGVLFLRENDIEVAIISGEDTQIVKARANKLKINHCFLGVSDKVAVAEKLCRELRLSLEQVAFIGDDINDLSLLRKVALSGTPQQAPRYLKKEVDYVCQKKGGEGAFREFVEYYLEQESLLEETINRIVKR